MFRLTGFLFISLLVLVFGCTKESDEVAPTIKTTPASSISSISAVAGGVVTISPGIVIAEQGVCYNTSIVPTGVMKRIVSTAKENTFTVTLADLTAKTTYYVRAYAISNSGTVYYGDPISFTTTEASVADVFTDAQYFFSSGNILYAGADTYSYTTGCNLQCKSGKGGFKIESVSTLVSKEDVGKGMKFCFAVNAPQVEIGKEYSFAVPLYGEATAEFFGIFANPTISDDHKYVWYDDHSTVVFTTFTPNQIKGKINGRFARLVAAVRSRAEVSFEFKK